MPSRTGARGAHHCSALEDGHSAEANGLFIDQPMEAGQGPLIKKSEDWVSDKTFNGETVAGPFFNGANPDQFAVYFTLDITPKATGKRITREEIAEMTYCLDVILTKEGAARRVA